MIKHIITLTVSFADYEADEYGNPECQLHDLHLPLIRVVKALRDCRLGEAKRAVEDMGLQSSRGRITLSLAASDAGLGRLYLLHRESIVREIDWYEGRIKRAPSTFTIEGVETYGAHIIHEEV